MDAKLLDVLVCPICKGKLRYQKKPERLVCKFDRLAYPIVENMPVLLEKEADSLSLEETEACQ